MQHGFNLADEACEEALLDSTALRRFVGIDLGCERVPDGTTLLRFRRLLEWHQFGEKLFATVGEVPAGARTRKRERRELDRQEFPRQSEISGSTSVASCASDSCQPR